jgi:hypothetical protein
VDFIWLEEVSVPKHDPGQCFDFNIQHALALLSGEV